MTVMLNFYIKSLFYLTFLVLSIDANAQQHRHIKNLFKRANPDWNKIELSLKKKDKNNLIEMFSRIPKIDSLNYFGFNNDVKNLHFVNLNQDKFPDVIYATSLGVSPIYFFLGKQDTFELLLYEDLSYLKEISYQNDTTIIILDVPPYIESIQSEITICLKQDKIISNSMKSMMDCMQEPQTYFKSSLPIRIILDDCPIRENARISKGECFYEDGDLEYNNRNNILRRYPKNTEGLAWGERFDAFGNKWWLVEILSKTEFRENFHQIGWMNAIDLEIIVDKN
jgi:hypothetical protein